MNIINKIIRKLSGAELAQKQAAAVLGGKANESIVPLLRKAGADGCVLLKNDGALPFNQNDSVAVFGRVQNDWFFVGNGSGGDVCTPYKTSLIDSIEAEKPFKIDLQLKEKYKTFSDTHKVDPGFWAHWPRFYPEMKISDSEVKSASERNTKALVIIGRSAGEDRENVLKKGSYYLTDTETKLLDSVTRNFKSVTLLLNIGSLTDFEKIASYKDRISSIMLVWQGGMESGNSVCDVLSGKVSPSGKLTDTIALRYDDYPSAHDFGNRDENKYTEDIFVGYRYFETFCPEKVLYEFGFGLSYTEFSQEIIKADFSDGKFTAEVKIKNIGKVSGREVVQLYVCAPLGKLPKPKKVLTAFKKTKLLAPDEEEIVTLSCGEYSFASFDDDGSTKNINCYVTEGGNYDFYIGKSVKSCVKVFSFTQSETKVLEQLSEVLAVPDSMRFNRLSYKVESGKITPCHSPVPYRTTNLRDIILKELPKGQKHTGDRNIKLRDVRDGKAKMSDFVAQLSPDELELITRGEGPMNSSLGAKGNAGAIGGVSESLREKGIPPIITTDGPSGIRLLTSCSLMPCGTALACTWDTELIESLFDEMGKEMVEKGSDVLLAPGMNIHRSPLCGRNFEYYSEDPVLSGEMAVSTVLGIQKNGVSACPKHFACNNQEYNRNYNNSVVSQRALREIYLKGFEICVKKAKPLNIMTSYNKINGVWSHYNYELCTSILRNEWNYDGAVMTDWWMRYASSPEFPELNGNAYRVRAQVDVLMPGGKTAMSKSFEPDGTLLETYQKDGGITLGEMQRCAENVLNMALRTNKGKNL